MADADSHQRDSRDGQFHREDNQVRIVSPNDATTEKVACDVMQFTPCAGRSGARCDAVHTMCACQSQPFGQFICTRISPKTTRHSPGDWPLECLIAFAAAPAMDVCLSPAPPVLYPACAG